MPKDDIVIAFGPQGKYTLNIPIKDVEATEKTGKSFITAGMALVLYARGETEEQQPKDLQKLFDWMLNPDEKAA